MIRFNFIWRKQALWFADACDVRFQKKRVKTDLNFRLQRLKKSRCHLLRHGLNLRLVQRSKSSFFFYLIHLGSLTRATSVIRTWVEEVSIGWRKDSGKLQMLFKSRVLFISLTHAIVFAIILSARNCLLPNIRLALPLIAWGFCLLQTGWKHPPPIHHCPLCLPPPPVPEITFLNLRMYLLSTIPPGVQASGGLNLSLPVAPSAPRTVPDTLFYKQPSADWREKKGIRNTVAQSHFPGDTHQPEIWFGK